MPYLWKTTTAKLREDKVKVVCAEFICDTRDRKEIAPRGQSQERFPGQRFCSSTGHLTVGAHWRFVLILQPGS